MTNQHTGTQLENPCRCTSGVETQMAPPQADRLTREPGELVRLGRDEPSWAFQMKQELEDAGIQAGDTVEFDLMWDETGPMLVAARVDPDEPAPPGLEDRRRSVIPRDRSLLVHPPVDLIEGDPSLEAGLGIDSDEYDTSNALYFEPLVDDGLVGLVPVAYEDQTPFEPTQDAGTPETIDLPETVAGIPREQVQAAADTTGVRVLQLADALEALQDTITEHGVEIEAAEKYDDLEVQDRVVRFVTPEEASRVIGATPLPQIYDDRVLEAVLLAHVKAAETFVQANAPGQYAWFSDQYRALVFPN